MSDTSTPTSANVPPKSVSMRDQPADATPEELAANIAEEKTPKDDKWLARWAFHAVNFFGLHFIFNSTTSLFIAYNLLPTRPAKALKEALGKLATPVNEMLYKLTVPIKKAIQGSAFKELSKEEMAANIAHSARSRVETGFMVIAGFIALWPVKYLEDHRAQVTNFFDNLFHPGRSKEEREAVALKPEDEPKETWTNLLRARFVGLGVVFGIDALQQRFNNWLGYEKGNIDTAVWKWGADASDKINTGLRNRIVNFFSRKGVTLGSIQSDMRSYLLHSIDSPKELHNFSDSIGKLQTRMEKTADKTLRESLSKQIDVAEKAFQKSNPHLVPQMERAIFAEQSRLLLTKEIFLTLVCAATIYTAAKAPFMARFFEKVGLKKAPPKADKPETDSGALPPAGEGSAITAPEPQETNHAAAVKRKDPVAEAKEHPADKPVIKPAQDWQTSVTKADAQTPNLSQAI